MKIHKKGFIVQGVVGIVALILIAGVAYYLGTGGFNLGPEGDVVVNPPVDEETVIESNSTKTYTDPKNGYSFQYPAKLSLVTTVDGVNLSHTIPFENHNGGCDLRGDSELSKTLGDFGLSIQVIEGEIKPAYIDGKYSKGVLNGSWSYMGAEGCGQTKYIFPITGGKTLVVMKSEIQILSDVVSPDTKAKVLAVPGVISQQEAKLIVDQILSSFKFTSKIAVNWKNYSGVTSSGSSFTIKYPEHYVLFKYSCNVNGVAFWPESQPRVIPTGNACPQEMINSAPIIVTTETKPQLTVVDQNYKEDAKNFTITISAASQPSITFLSPNGGEILKVGETYQILWNSSGLNMNSKVDIILSSVGTGGPREGEAYELIKTVDNTGKYLWTITSPVSVSPNNTYTITIYDKLNKNVLDTSDKPFTITTSAQPQITVISPNGGESVRIGQSLGIQWKSNITLPSEYKFVINAGANDFVINTNPVSNTYLSDYVIPKYRVTGDILGDVNPGQYKVKVSLYDGKVPLYNGKTCSELVQLGQRMWCNSPDLYGTIITEDQSNNSFTITN